MKKKILLLLFLSFSILCFSQKVDTAVLKKKLILTEEKNEAWLSLFKSADQLQQINLLKERISLDTNVVLIKIFPDGHLLKIGKCLSARNISWKIYRLLQTFNCY